MKLKTIIGLSFLILGSLFVISFLHKVGVKGQYQYSTSISESKKNGFYIAEYIPTEKTINLKLRHGTIVLDTAWAEFAWHMQANNFVSSKVKVNDKGYNIAFKIKSSSTDKFIYNLDFKSAPLGQIGGFNLINKQYESTIYSLPDTITVFLEEKNLSPDLGWLKPIITDTLTYIKK